MPAMDELMQIMSEIRNHRFLYYEDDEYDEMVDHADQLRWRALNEAQKGT
jgi:hypothetical protein